MTIDLHCAVCGRRFEPDDEHRWINAEKKPQTEEFAAVDEYAMHLGCWQRVTEGWRNPNL